MNKFGLTVAALGLSSCSVEVEESDGLDVQDGELADAVELIRTTQGEMAKELGARWLGSDSDPSGGEDQHSYTACVLSHSDLEGRWDSSSIAENEIETHGEIDRILSSERLVTETASGVIACTRLVANMKD